MAECFNFLCRRGKEETKKICSRCKKARYCNETCQHEHWEEHKRYCGKSPELDRPCQMYLCAHPTDLLWCKAHACALQGCDEQKHFPSNYCAKHVCIVERCTGRRGWCLQHRMCLADGCPRFARELYCPIHRCEVCGGDNRLCGHYCALSICTKKADEGHVLCQFHRCYVDPECMQPAHICIHQCRRKNCRAPAQVGELCNGCRCSECGEYWRKCPHRCQSYVEFECCQNKAPEGEYCQKCTCTHCDLSKFECSEHRCAVRGCKHSKWFPPSKGRILDKSKAISDHCKAHSCKICKVLIDSGSVACDLHTCRFRTAGGAGCNRDRVISEQDGVHCVTHLKATKASTKLCKNKCCCDICKGVFVKSANKQ